MDRNDDTDGAFTLLERAERGKRRGPGPRSGVVLPLLHVLLTWNSKESEKSTFDLVFPASLKTQFICCCCSVSRSCPTLGPHGLQHARLPCPFPSPRVCTDSCPLSW